MIVNLINKNQKVTVANLCNEFSVSPVTIRNDLNQLEKEGFLQRTHGGAINNRRQGYTPAFAQNEKEQEEKAIARKALKYIREGDMIALDSGSATFELAKLLVQFKDITVVTSDFQIGAFLERNTNLNIIMTGDTVWRGLLSFDTIKELKVNKAFLTANGFHLKKGITANDIERARIKSAFIEIADQTILVMDSSKFGKSALVRFANINQIDVLVTDSGINKEYIDQTRRFGFKIVIS